jgi:hypothetical protein
MKVRAIANFSGDMGSIAKGYTFEAEESVAQDLLNAGYVVEVDSCPTCGSVVDKDLLPEVPEV